MRTKILCFILTITMILTITPFSVMAEENNDFMFKAIPNDAANKLVHPKKPCHRCRADAVLLRRGFSCSRMFHRNICIGIGLSVFYQIQLIIDAFKLSFIKKLAVPKPDRKSLFAYL